MQRNEMTTQETEIRKKRLHFGLVFQSFNLFPTVYSPGKCHVGKRTAGEETAGL